MDLERWCARRDGSRHGPHVVWAVSSTASAPKDTLRQAIREGRIRRMQWYRDGRLHGLSVHYVHGRADFKNKNVISTFGRFSSGQRQGRWWVLHPGQSVLRALSYRSGRLHGDWAEYHLEGHPWVTGRYVEGQRHGRWNHWSRDGKLLASHLLRGGTGTWSEWYPDGQKLLQGALLGGKPQGEWSVWHPDGSRAARVKYKRGVLSGAGKLWRRSGAVLDRSWQGKMAGAVNQAEITEVRKNVERHINEIKYCYQKELQSQPFLSGKVFVELDIAPEGQVIRSRVQPINSTLKNRRVMNCIANSPRRWLFHRSKERKPRRVVLPFFIDLTPPSSLHRKHGTWIRGSLAGILSSFSMTRYDRALFFCPIPSRD